MPDWFDERSRPSPPIAGTLAALAAFVLLAALVAIDPGGLIARTDAALSTFVREPPSFLFDRLMVGATLFGDFPLTVTLMLSFASMLFVAGFRALALHALALFTATKLLVSLCKVWIDRARPVELYPGGDVYSFPSGHTASAAALIGAVAILFLARRASPATALAFAVPAALVALSRVRLGAHWPSDVIASLSLVAFMLLPFAWHVRLHAHRGERLPPRLAPIALGGLLGGWALYLVLFGVSASRYYPGAFSG